MSLDCEDIDFQPTNASYYRRELKKAQAENAELRAKLSAQDLQVMYLEKRLDAWEKQEPVAWMYVNVDGECEQIEYGLTEYDDWDEQTLLFTKPKEA